MSLVLFAIIGAKLNMGAAYWVCFGALCLLNIVNAFVRVKK